MFNRVCDNHKVCARAFFVVWHLIFTDVLKLCLGHRASLKNAFLLDLWRDEHAGNSIHVGLAPCLEQERNVQNDDISSRLRQKCAPVFDDKRMDNAFNRLERAGLTGHNVTQSIATNGISPNGIWIDCAKWGNRCTTFRVKPMDGCIRIPEGATFIDEHLRSR